VKAKLKAHLWTSGRFFALPFFGGAALIGSLLAGGTPTARIATSIGLSVWIVLRKTSLAEA